MLHRRSFLERLSLSAGAFFLTSIVNGVLSEARGATAARKRLLLVLSGNGWSNVGGDGGKQWVQGMFQCTGFVPPELRELTLKNRGIDTGAFFSSAANEFTLSPSMQALMPFKNQMLLVDGLTNRQWTAPGALASGHGQGFATLACVPNSGNASHDGHGTPGGITFDQYLAGTMGKDSLYRSVNLATVNDPNVKLASVACAAGAGRPVQSYCSPREAFTRLFTGLQTGTPDPRVDALFAAKKSVLDFVAADVQRLQSVLVGEERRKLDEHLTSIRSLEKRLGQKVDISAACQPGTAPMADSPALEDRQQAHMDIATTALLCGITQVAVVLNAVGPDIAWGARYTRTAGQPVTTHTIAHNEVADSVGIVHRINNFHAGLVAKAASRMAAVREGDRSVLDNSAVVWMNESGADHHCTYSRYPLVVLGNAGGALKTDGRYLRYPMHLTMDNPTREVIPAGVRSLPDFFCTLGHALGAPIDDFGKAGRAPVKGPLGSEILV